MDTQTCTSRNVTTEIDGEDMGEQSSRERNDYDCLYTDEDRWDCPALPNDIVRGAGQSIVSARGLVQTLPAADPNHGFSLPEVQSQIRAELERRRREEAEFEDLVSTGDEEAEFADPVPTGGQAPQPSARAHQGVCAFVVADPNPPLRVRAEANARSLMVGELANGTPLTLGERRGGFARIETPHAGWVWTENLREACE